MAKQVTRRCHWVAQSYLKAFASDVGQQRIWRFSRDEGEPELKRIDKVAVRHHLYAPQGPDGQRDDAMERKLSELESYFGDPMWKAACNDYPDYGWRPLRKLMALIVAVSYLRTPMRFEFWKDLHRQFVDMYSGFDALPDTVTMNGKTIKLNHDSWPTFRDAREEDMKVAWNQALSGAGDLAKYFLKMRWAVLFSDEPVFITSDNPVTLGDTIGPYRGLRHPDTMVTFPISPTRILIMDNRHDEPDAHYYRINHDPASTNVLIWRNAINHMFSPRHPDEVCAEMLADAERQGYA